MRERRPVGDRTALGNFDNSTRHAFKSTANRKQDAAATPASRGHQPAPLTGWGFRKSPGSRRPRRPIDFALVNRVALRELPALLARWLPGGKRHGHEYLARNPRRRDRRPGSFSINMISGRWADFATGDRGGDVISLAAFVAGIGQYEAAERLADMLGVEARRGR
jgi:hypothetical protein